MIRILPWATAFVLCLVSDLSAASPVPGNPPWVALDAGSTLGAEQGWAVDISGNLAVVGAPFVSGGRAFIFDVNTGQLVHQLQPSDGTSLFGFSVAIDHDLAVIAAGQANAAYVFDVNTGQQLRKLTPVSSNFVRSVDISDGRAVLGVPLEPSSGSFPSEAGAAFVYDARAGNLLYRLNGPTGNFKREFGSTVAIEGNTVAVSSPSDFARHDVDVFNAATGQLQWRYGYTNTGQQIRVNDIAIDNNKVVVGNGRSAYDISEAIVLDRSSGGVLKRFDTRVPNENDDNKYQLDISGDRLVVGSWGTYHNGEYYVGDAHIFDVNSGQLLGSVANPRPSGGDDFGFAVAIEGNRLIVGAHHENSSAGMTYSFFLVPEPSTASLLILTLLGLPRRLREGR